MTFQSRHGRYTVLRPDGDISDKDEVNDFSINLWFFLVTTDTKTSYSFFYFS